MAEDVGVFCCLYGSSSSFAGVDVEGPRYQWRRNARGTASTIETRSWFRLGGVGSQTAIEDANVMIQPPSQSSIVKIVITEMRQGLYDLHLRGSRSSVSSVKHFS